MHKLAFNAHHGIAQARDRKPVGGHVAERERAHPHHRKIPVSPHLLDLKSADKAKPASKPVPPPSAPRGVIGRLRHMLDEKIHLHDLRMRTLSIRPRGWKDFPPANATTMTQAVRITVSRFFNEHPLADLTVLSVLHLTALMIWHVVKFPAASASARLAKAEKEAAEPRLATAPSFLPLLVIAEPSAIEAAPDDARPIAAAKTGAAPVRRFRLEWQPGWQRSVLGFASLALLLALPLGVYGSFGGLLDGKDRVLSESVEAVSLLKAAGDAAKSRDFGAASIAFGQAKENFTDAKRQLGALATMLNAAPAILPGTAISAAGPLLNAGREIAEGGERLSTGLAALDRASDPTEKIDAVKTYLRDALPHLERASRELARVSPASIPAEYRGAVTDAQAEIPRLTAAVRKANAVADVMGGILGQYGPKRYLVIFQNNAELRPTGGFMGSFALVDVDKGKVKKMDIPGGGTYDLKGSLAARLSSPQPLHLINPRWQFQDANWYPDFPTSARQIDWFYGKAGGPTTDGVIAVTATFMEKLLAITGPIDMPEYGKTITAQNFFYETQKAVELDYDKQENRPKQFLADLAPKVLDKIMNGDRSGFMALAATLDDSLAKKEIQFWTKDRDAESRIADLGWAGEMKAADRDYLAVVHTNIAGQKTDLMMKDDLHHSVKVLPDGTGIVTLTLSRTHGGQKGALFSGVRNVDYLRVYVPKGSALVEARGFSAPDPKLFKLADPEDADDPAIAEQERTTKIDRASGTRVSEEGGKTVFGNWMQTDPGETSTVTLVYQLPPGTIGVTRAAEGRFASLIGKFSGQDRDRLEYSLLVQKQAGANPAAFASSIDLPRGFYPTWQRPERTEDDRGRWTMRGLIEKDAFFGAVAESQ
ncbi:MAG: hypothetical protein RL272_1166 [Candidatus Parcubacteria bacterium]|jgi:hypothetical protein